jgi:hypothetical protein
VTVGASIRANEEIAVSKRHGGGGSSWGGPFPCVKVNAMVLRFGCARTMLAPP